uniref:Uncharacterized protein n=1 Tax=viral metagenome TaxID=1070528 RepID=A0A6M3JG43_9ZZZZ
MNNVSKSKKTIEYILLIMIMFIITHTVVVLMVSVGNLYDLWVFSVPRWYAVTKFFFQEATIIFLLILNLRRFM